MKKQFLPLAVRCSAAGLALFAASCEKSAPGLGKATGDIKEKSVYDGVGATSTANPTAAATVTPATPKPATPPVPAKPIVSNTPPPVVTPPPTPKPPMTTPPPVVTTPAPKPVPAPKPAPAPTPPPVAVGGKITIKPAMPKPLFAGTPLPDNNPPPNLDKSAKPTLEAQVPEGVTLLSKGKPVTCSDANPLGELTLITDGDKEGDDGYFVDILPGKQWIQIDLGEAKEIHLLWVWHYHKVAAVYKDVVAQISDDPEFKTSTTVFNNDFDNSSEFGVGKDQSWVETNNGRSMPVSGVKGRYVRLWSNGRNVDDTNHYIEVEVYGK